MSSYIIMVEKQRNSKTLKQIELPFPISRCVQCLLPEIIDNSIK